MIGGGSDDPSEQGEPGSAGMPGQSRRLHRAGRHPIPGPHDLKTYRTTLNAMRGLFPPAVFSGRC